LYGKVYYDNSIILTYHITVDICGWSVQYVTRVTLVRHCTANGPMARYSATDIHPDLAKERQTRTFDPEIVTRILDGGEWITNKRRELGE